MLCLDVDKTHLPSLTMYNGNVQLTLIVIHPYTSPAHSHAFLKVLCFKLNYNNKPSNPVPILQFSSANHQITTYLT